MKNKFDHLIECIENTFGSKILYSKDCTLLSNDIFDKTLTQISAQTLRRLFGFIDDDVQISKSTLNYLAVFCGFENYEDFSNIYKKSTNTADSKDIKYVKLFFSINPKNSNLDENYHNVSKNIAKLLLSNEDLLNRTSTFLAKNKSSQIYFFERFPHIDTLSTGYAIHLAKYIKEKNNYEAQLFGNCLLYLGYALSNNPKRTAVLKLINAIPEEQIYHPFPLARKFASNILEHYLNNNDLELEKWIIISIKEASNVSKWKKEFINFPYFQFIIADIFNMIERPFEAQEILKICDLDYKRIPDFSLDEGYIEALDLIKAINFFQLGKVSESKRILNRTKSKDIIFIMHDYFLIQRLLVELNLVTSKHSSKYLKIKNEIKRLITKTKFEIFNGKLVKM